MVKITINGQCIETQENNTILQAAASAGIRIPTLCYLKDINEIGACRVCAVEVDTQSLSLPATTGYRKGW